MKTDKSQERHIICTVKRSMKGFWKENYPPMAVHCGQGRHVVKRHTKNMCSILLLTCLWVLSGLGVPTSHAASPVTEHALNGITLMIIEDSRAPVRPAIFEGIENTPEKLALLTGKTYPTNTFVIKIEGRPILIDAGWGQEAARKGETLKLLVDAGIQPVDIEQILITHMHTDHISGLIHQGKPVFSNAKVYISKPEFDYWVVNGADTNPDFVDLARRVASAYDGKIMTFAFGDTLAPGIVAESAIGHTPGQAAFTVTNGDKQVTIMGDMMHVAELQFAYPEMSPTFDVDPLLAAKTRTDMLENISNSKGLIAGGHITGIGRVERKKPGGFTYTPLDK